MSFPVYCLLSTKVVLLNVNTALYLYNLLVYSWLNYDYFRRFSAKNLFLKKSAKGLTFM